jgi:methionyl-tRNA formyltransferase
VAAAILNGDETTGVTIMRMDAGLDTGPILAQESLSIAPGDTRATLEERLADLGSGLLTKTLPAYVAGEIEARPQPGEGVTHAGQLRKQDGLIDWSLPALALDRRVRAFTPWPGAFTTLRGQRLRILETTPLPDLRDDAPPGTVIALDDGAAVVTGNGALQLKRVQMAGKQPLDIAAFLCGRRDCVGVCLGSVEEM